MPVMNCTAFMRDDDGHGWSEGYQIFDGNPAPSITPFLLNFDTLMRKFRAPLLAGDGYYIGCRVSYKRADGRLAGGNRLADLPVRGTAEIGDQEIQMNLASDAVKFRMQNATSTANSDVYLRGVWDQVIQAGQLNFAGAIGGKFAKLLKSYQDALISERYGWFGINPDLSPRGIVQNATQNADDTVTFELLTTNGVAMPVLTGTFQFRAARINNGKSVLNRTFVVTQVDATHVRTIKGCAFGSFDTKGTWVIPIKGFIQFDHLTYNKADQRKTGRVFGAGRGRLPAQVLS